MNFRTCANLRLPESRSAKRCGITSPKHPFQHGPPHCLGLSQAHRLMNSQARRLSHQSPLRRAFDGAPNFIRSRVNRGRPDSASTRLLIQLIVFLLSVGAPSSAYANDGWMAASGRRLPRSAPEALLGERLFFETRFAQYFYAHFDGDVNQPLPHGDSVVDEVERLGQPALPGPFRGRSISCRHCHLGDDFYQSEPLGQRTYADFAARSRIPKRDDGLVRTVRNTSQMVDLGLSREVPQLFHYDGEFASAEELTIATLTGRNMGWLLDEHATAIRHVARVVREDEGVIGRYGEKADLPRLPYRVALLGAEHAGYFLQISSAYRIDVLASSDDEVLLAIARLIHAYMDSIRFGSEDTDRDRGSPYDLFLLRNNLPSKPDSGESYLAYARRLAKLVQSRSDWKWVSPPQDGEFRLHRQPYQFGQGELNGLRIFLSEPGASSSTGVGNCISCHAPPLFTDHAFHNTGISQAEYDAVFGPGAFASLRIPNLRMRTAHHDAYLPATVQHPNAIGRFRAVPTKERPGYVDLGVWNIFANPDFPTPQRSLTLVLCGSGRVSKCTASQLLPKTVAMFKTPSIRDLGHSQPYFHNGTAQTLDDVLVHYRKAAHLARTGRLRNASSELSSVELSEEDGRYLVQFIMALNEDYR